MQTQSSAGPVVFPWKQLLRPYQLEGLAWLCFLRSFSRYWLLCLFGFSPYRRLIAGLRWLLVPITTH